MVWNGCRRGAGKGGVSQRSTPWPCIPWHSCHLPFSRAPTLQFQPDPPLEDFTKAVSSCQQKRFNSNKPAHHCCMTTASKMPRDSPKRKAKHSATKQSYLLWPLERLRTRLCCTSSVRLCMWGVCTPKCLSLPKPPAAHIRVSVNLLCKATLAGMSVSHLRLASVGTSYRLLLGRRNGGARNVDT